MNIETLTILMPCFNEENFVVDVLKKVSQVALEGNVKKEIIIIDDHSTDGTKKAIEEFIFLNAGQKIRLIIHEKNKGKGACIRTGLQYTSGQAVIIQDTDLEYDPFEYNKLLRPILNGHADVVYGSRFRGSEAHRVLFFLHTIGNKVLTFWSNLLTGLNLSDMETGYKMFKTEIIQNIKIKENRFGFEPEITSKISRIKKIRIYEVGISYYGRRYDEGKKIKWVDGIRAFYCIFKYNIFPRK
jgi:glycosyltransferase involved in cell wall biosynthesis